MPPNGIVDFIDGLDAVAFAVDVVVSVVISFADTSAKLDTANAPPRPIPGRTNDLFLMFMYKSIKVCAHYPKQLERR